MRLIAVLLNVLFLSAALAAVPVPFAVVTGNEAVATREIWVGILDEVSEFSGHSLKLKLVHDHDSIEEGFLSGDFILAAVDPRHMKQMRQEHLAQPLLEVTDREGSGVNTGLYVRKDSVIRTLEDLNGRTIAILPPGIHCASNELPAEMLDSIPGIQVTSVLVDTPESIIKAVRYGAVDAGVIAEIIPGQAPDTENLRLIAESEPVAFWYVVVRTDYSESVISAIKDALLSYDGAYRFRLPEENESP